MKASGRAHCEWATWSHSYLPEETRVGEITVPDGVWTPIMPLPMRFHGNVGGGAVDVYGLDLGIESLSGFPSSTMI